MLKRPAEIGASDAELQAAVDAELLPAEAAHAWIDSDTKGFLLSLVAHALIICLLAMIPLLGQKKARKLQFTAYPLDLTQDLEFSTNFEIAEIPDVEVGAESLENSPEQALSMAPLVSEISEIPIPEIETKIAPIPTFELANEIAQAVGMVESNDVVKGVTGVGATGTDGAVDRLTYEILQSMESQPTLVVWLFDASGSLIRRRQEIRDRFDRIYDELGIVQGDSFTADREDAPLLTSVMAFGSSISLQTQAPTNDLEEIKSAVDSVPVDTSGQELTFSALYQALEKYKAFRRKPKSGPARNIMMVVVTDERGDDIAGLEKTIDLYQKFAVPVYVLGVPAPFGREQTFVKYVDPDPAYDQTPSWAPVDQGPESAFPERVKIGYELNAYEEPVVDSGFGPYALSRLCYETGGMYFSIHPNRRLGSRVSRREVEVLASNMTYFFDPQVMIRYQPDYVSLAEYRQRLQSSPLRQSLRQAADFVRTGRLEQPRMRFERINEASFVEAVSRAQTEAARLEPKLNSLVELLEKGAAHRDRELSPRWLANFDLSYGTALAEKVRAETYNLMLANAKQGLQYSDPKNNTWTIRPSNEISVGSRYQKAAELARETLTRVVKEHPGTPWELLAKQQLSRPIGWTWVDSFTDPNPPPPQPAGNNNPPPPPRDDQIRMIQQKPKRPVPKL